MGVFSRPAIAPAPVRFGCNTKVRRWAQRQRGQGPKPAATLKAVAPGIRPALKIIKKCILRESKAN